MSKKRILCIMGKSGTGKSTLINEICKDDIYHYVKSKTTRKVRVNDPNDINTHIFSTPDEFNKDLVNGNILATYVSPNHYINWTSEDLILEDKINVYAIDPIAFNELCDLCKDDYDIFGVYIDVPEEIRKDRIEKRGDIYVKEPHLRVGLLKDKQYYKVLDGTGTIEEIYNRFKKEI